MKNDRFKRKEVGRNSRGASPPIILSPFFLLFLSYLFFMGGGGFPTLFFFLFFFFLRGVRAEPARKKWLGAYLPRAEKDYM